MARYSPFTQRLYDISVRAEARAARVHKRYHGCFREFPETRAFWHRHEDFYMRAFELASASAYLDHVAERENV